jgi:hypothetical protein
MEGKMLQPNDSSQTNNSEASTTTSLQPMGFTDILDTIFSLYRNHFRLIFGICIVYFVLMLGLNLLSGISIFFFSNSGPWGIVIGIPVITSWFTLLISLVSIGVLLFAGAQAYLGRQIATGTAFRQITRRFWSYLGSTLLYVLIVGLLVVTCIGIPFAIYFAVRWGFYAQAVLIEETSATNALRRSSELVKGTWWRVFGILFAIFLLAFMIQTILQFSLLFGFGLTQAISGEGGVLKMLERLFIPELTTWDGLVNYIIQSFINSVVTSLMLPVGIIGSTLLYFDQRIRKEGFDIEMRVTDTTV